MSIRSQFNNIANSIFIRIDAVSDTFVLVGRQGYKNLDSDVQPYRVTSELETKYLTSGLNTMNMARLNSIQRQLDCSLGSTSLKDAQNVQLRITRALRTNTLRMYRLPSASLLQEKSEIPTLPEKILGAVKDQIAETNWVELQYCYSDDTGVVSANYIVFDLQDNVLAKGKLNASGYARVTLPQHIKEVNVQFDNDPENVEEIRACEPKLAEQPPKGWLNRMGAALADAGEWTWGTIKGDFNETPTGAQIITNAIITAIPVVDQIADVRDIVANLKLLIVDKRYGETVVWIAFFFTLIGLIPTVGSVVKGVLKLIYKNVGAVLRQIIELFNYFRKGNAIKWLKQLQADMGKYASDAAKIGTDIFNAVISKLDEFKGYVPKWMNKTHAQINDWLKTLNILKSRINGQFSKIGDEFAEKIGKVLAKREKELVRGRTKTTVTNKQVAAEPTKEKIKVADELLPKIKPGRYTSINKQGYKIYQPPYSPLSQNKANTYRYSDPTFRTNTGGDVYFGESLETSFHEVRKNTKGKAVLKANIKMEKMLDLTDPAIIKEFNIDYNKITRIANDNDAVSKAAVYKYTNSISNQAYAAGYNGIIFESSRHRGNNCILIFADKFTGKNVEKLSDSPYTGY